jgi:hypothetical protein
MIPNDLASLILEDGIKGAWIDENLIVTFLADDGAEAVIVEQLLSEIIKNGFKSGYDIDAEKLASQLESLAAEIRELPPAPQPLP